MTLDLSKFVLRPDDDLDRLRTEYADRKQRLVQSDRYSPFNLAYLFALQRREREMLSLLSRHGIRSLADKHILEIGCGQGQILHQCLSYGADPKLLTGIDLLPDRIRDAHIKLPRLPLTCGDGQYLPYADSSFDMLMQYTVFSSILNSHIKANMAHEMLRVLKPSGMIIWYDFWVNPTNHQTRGIRLIEIRRLFPGCTFDYNKITLAPPITRRFVSWSWMLCLLLEKLQVLNTHYLVAIRPI